MKFALNCGLILLTAMYPFAIFFGIQHWDIRYLAILLITVAVLRTVTSKITTHTQQPFKWLWLLGAIALALWTWLDDSALGVKFYPVLVSLSMLSVFSWSLWHPPCIIERLARLRQPNLPSSAIGYTRKVTIVWCLFFSINASIATATCFWGNDKVWALYNGLISYLLMGTLFAGEWVVRLYVQRGINE